MHADSSIRIQGEPSSTIDCDMELNVKEGAGQVVIPLIRDGFSNQEVGAVCYTEDITTSGGADYNPRPYDAPESVVKFGVNNSVAECVVTIVDDRVYEVREQFLVHVGNTPTQRFVNVDPAFASLCVFISHDENDSKPRR